jgi:hypothetical protein
MKIEAVMNREKSLISHITKNYKIISLVILLYVVQAFDFIVKGKSSLAIHYERPFLDYKALQTSGAHNDILKRSTGESWIDIGGTAFQSNPISYVVNYSNSIFWTDLIASGNGIIDDFTFQPLSFTNLVSTIFGPSLYYSHISFLLLLFLAFLTFSFYLNKRHALDVVPSVIGGICLCFTGFVTSGWANTVVLPYLAFPTALLAISYYLEGRIKIYLPIILTAFLLLNTFLPVLLLCLFAIPILIMCERSSFDFSESNGWKKIRKISVVYFISISVVTIAYLPALNQLMNSGAFEEYNNKSNDFYLPWRSIFLFLGPLQPWRNFNSLYVDNFDIWNYGGFSVPYFGIVCIYLIILSIFSKRKLVLVAWIIVMLMLLRLYTPLAFYSEYIPILRSISYGYIFSLVSIMASVLVAFGTQVIVKRKKKWYQLLILALLVSIEYFYYNISNGGKLSLVTVVVSTFLFVCLFALVFLDGERLKSISIVILVAMELFLLQNHNKVEFKDLADISPRVSIQSLLSSPNIGDFRVLNTGFHILPQNLAGALNLAEISTLGHLSLNKEYQKIYSDSIGTDDAKHAIHGFTDCRNLKPDLNYLNNMAVKYILTDRAYCSTVFAGIYPIEYQDDAVLIFRNPNAKKIISVQPSYSNSECKLSVNKNQLSRVYHYDNCYGILTVRINFKNDFRYSLNGAAFEPKDTYPIGKEFPLHGAGKIEIVYSNIYLYSIYISLFSIFAVLVHFVNNLLRRPRNAKV